MSDPRAFYRDSGDETPVGALVGCPSAVGIADWPGRDDGVGCTDECTTCQRAGVVEKIGFSSYQRLEGYR